MRAPGLIPILLLGASWAVVPPALAQDDAGAKLVATACASCHGLDGNSTEPTIPKLAGMLPRYVVKQLRDFAAGTRRNEVAIPCANGLGDKEVEQIAAYLGDQKPVRGGTANDALFAAGKTLYELGNPASGVDDCQECHRGNGAGSGLYPRVAGQHAAYSMKQLRAFRTHARNNDKNEVMHEITEKMTDEEMRAVAEYMMAM